LLVAGCLSLVAGCWLLVTGRWLLVTGHWSLVAGHWLLVTGCWLLAAGRWLLEVNRPLTIHSVYFSFRFIAVVKKTFHFPNDLFYSHLYQPSVFRNLFLKSGIIRIQQFPMRNRNPQSSDIGHLHRGDVSGRSFNEA